MKALHFGAGNIGRGLIGKMLSESGFNIIFSDINQNIVNSINYNKEYSVKIVGKSQNDTINIKRISAIHVNDPHIIKIISLVTLITTAVGFNALDKISLIIMQGIKLRYKINSIIPLNIIACENKINASTILKEYVLEKLPIKYHDYFKKYIGFVDCSIDTIVPNIINQNYNNLSVVVEEFKEWIVNPNQFKGSIPKIINMKLSNQLNAFIDRKLFTLNTGHAIAAYLGLIKQYKTINEAILDKQIYAIVKSSMKESGSVLIKKYNFNQNDHMSYINKILSRFQNPFLLDSLKRIARNPLQKLKEEERLIKPLLGCVKYHLPYYNLAKGIAAALHYHDKNDLESIKLFSLIKKKGIQKTLVETCNLGINSQELALITSEYISISREVYK